ncbi:hypothetical protein TruAng_005398 [Truncatella angustata]|nr:hypothetical protein TruAng_005398 [Truncatella angustata]
MNTDKDTDSSYGTSGHGHSSTPAGLTQAVIMLDELMELSTQDTIDTLDTVMLDTPVLATRHHRNSDLGTTAVSGGLPPSKPGSSDYPSSSNATPSSQALQKLQDATGRSKTPSVQRVSSQYLEAGNIRGLRRSSRIKSHTQVQDTLVAGGKKAVKKSKVTKATRTPVRFPRRSARLAKPLTEFYKYDDLPTEILLMIWEEASAGRAVYIRNRSASNFSLKVQNTQPSWFTADHISIDVAKRNYRKMFDASQLVHPDRDIIVLEPCCNGCRGYWCTRHQFSVEDRKAVRFMAVQTDSPYLLPTATPGWNSISIAFPNIETLYLLRTAVKGDQTTEKALLRIEENNHETQLRKKFEEWKLGEGKCRPLNRLEFAVAVDREPESIGLTNRYKLVVERATGKPKDIIIG